MLELKAQIRENIGKKLDDLRKKGVLPAVVYGYKQKSEPLAVDYKEFEKVYQEAGESSLIQLKTGDKDKKNVLAREIQRDPVSGKFIHVDFYAIREDQALKIKVPLVFLGMENAPAITELAGFLSRYIQEIEIEALPKNLPKELVVDVSGLKTFEDKIFIKDIIPPPGVKILANLDEVVATAEAPIAEEKLKEELEAPTEEKVEEVEVVERGKKEEKESGEEKKSE